MAVTPVFAKMVMLDGVTTGLDLENGAMHIAQWYDAQKGNRMINYGQSVSHEFARYVVHDGLEINDPIDTSDLYNLRAKSEEDGVAGWNATLSTLEQVNQITKLIDDGLREGGIGLGSGIGYMANGASTYEMFEAQRTAARYGRVSGMHSRFHSSTSNPEGQLGFDEVLLTQLFSKPRCYTYMIINMVGGKMKKNWL